MGAAAGELWLAECGIHHQPDNYFFSCTYCKASEKISGKHPQKGRIHYLMETIFRLRQKSSVAQWVELNVMHMVAVKSKFLKHHVWEGFLSLAFLFCPCTHWERCRFYLSEQDLGITGITEQWGVHAGKLPTDSSFHPQSCTQSWKTWHSQDSLLPFHRRREI